MKQKSIFGLKKKMTLFVAVILVIAIGTTVVLSYFQHKNEVEDYYMKTTSNIALTAAALVDGNAIQALLAKVRTPEYQELRAKAEEAEDEDMIKTWLRQYGFWLIYEETFEFLSHFRDNMGILYIYVESDQTADTMYLIDPDEPMYYLGKEEPSESEFAELVGDIHIDPMISNGEYGWICSAYEPVLNSSGDAVASIGVDLDMNKVRAAQEQFIWNMALSAVILLLLCAVLGILLVLRVVINPLEKLTTGLQSFSPSEDGDYEASHILPTENARRDEIGQLYTHVKDMEVRIVDSLKNLTQVTKEKERIGAELNIATQIQADMLPRIFPPFPDMKSFDIYASMDPAKEVGGDFYDFFLVDDHHIALVIADVSGKGVPAALFMVIAKTLIKNRAQMGGTPAEILRDVNNQLCEGNEAELFVTVWLAIIDLDTGEGLSANAGHEHPALCCSGGQYELVVYRHTAALAIMDGMRFRDREFKLNPGDRLVVYTDGVTEATNAQNELFGTDRMLEALNRNPEATPNEQLITLKKAIDDFVGEAPQFDDITMIAFYYKGPEDQEPID